MSPRAAEAGRSYPASRGRGSAGAGGGLMTYFNRSERPLHSLAFLLPLIAVYELGSRFSPSRLIAFDLLHRFFDFFGASAQIVPALAVVGILLTWHVARGDRWDVHVGTVLGMSVESVLLAVPLLVLSVAFARWHVRIPLYAGEGTWRDQAIIAVGAGVYEELVFRLAGLTLLHLVLVDVLRMPKGRAGVLMVVSSAVLFSLYHYLGVETFSWRTCVFRAAAGIYFGAIFLCRGFGVTAGCHAAYDVLVVAMVAGG